MRTLTIGEEIRILNELRHLDEIGAGSSRIVYECPREIVDFLKIDNSKDYVIKLAVGFGGFTQNRHEVDGYMNCDEYYFAEIAAFGHFVIIMEQVDTDDFRDFADTIYYDSDLDEVVDDWCDYNWEDATDEEKADLRKAAETIRYLADYYGSTSDNGQLGKTKDGRYVAYDYGFIAEEGCSTQCSDELMDNIYDHEVFNDYICKLIGTLHEILHVNMELDRISSRVGSIETEINYAHRC